MLDSRRGRRRRLDRVPMGESSRRQRHRHGRLQGQGRTRQGQWLSPHHPLSRRGFRRADQGNHRRRTLRRVYDGIGKTTFPASLDCLRRSACSSATAARPGQVEAFNINILQTKGSLFATRPTLNTYAAKREDLLAIANELFDVVAKGAVKIPINQKYALKDAVKAHKDLEGPQHHRLLDPDTVAKRQF